MSGGWKSNSNCLSVFMQSVLLDRFIVRLLPADRFDLSFVVLLCERLRSSFPHENILKQGIVSLAVQEP